MLPTTVPYLTLNDYLPSIQSDQLNNQLLDAIKSGGNQQRQFAESFAIGKVLSMLNDYFDFENELTPTLPFVYNKKYYPGDRIVIDFSDWVASSNSESEDDPNKIIYEVGDCRVRENSEGVITGYCCKKQNSDTSWKSENWTSIGNQYDIFYIPYPNPPFQLEVQTRRGVNVDGFYFVNDIVYFRKHLFKCISGTGCLSHQGYEQYISTANIPPANIFPGLQQGNKFGGDNQQWKDLGEYSFLRELPFYENFDVVGKNVSVSGSVSDDYIESDGTISNEVQLCAVSIKDTIWTLGDNRDSQLVQAIVDISLWRLCSRIAPGNIPKKREENFRLTWDWLLKVQKGEQSISIPKIMPTQVGDVSGGSSPKVINRLR